MSWFFVYEEEGDDNRGDVDVDVNKVKGNARRRSERGHMVLNGSSSQRCCYAVPVAPRHQHRAGGTYLRFLTKRELSAAFDGLTGLVGLLGSAASPLGLPLPAACRPGNPTDPRSLCLASVKVTGLFGRPAGTLCEL